jgi:hypothetical protein
VETAAIGTNVEFMPAQGAAAAAMMLQAACSRGTKADAVTLAASSVSVCSVAASWALIRPVGQSYPFQAKPRDGAPVTKSAIAMMESSKDVSALD